MRCTISQPQHPNNPPGSPHGTPRLSEQLGELAGRFTQRRVTLREVTQVLHGRAYMLMLIILALPFCTPLPLPGLSTPFGLIIGLIGFRLMLRLDPWLPSRLLDTRLPPQFFAALLRASRRLIALLEWGVRPRGLFWMELPLTQHLLGFLILFSGLLLSLPLPIPLTNSLPAMVVILCAAAMLERDGTCALIAIGMFLITLGYFLLLAWGGNAGFHALRSWLWG